jgi:hypothetical protein
MVLVIILEYLTECCFTFKITNQSLILMSVRTWLQNIIIIFIITITIIIVNLISLMIIIIVVY